MRAMTPAHRVVAGRGVRVAGTTYYVTSAATRLISTRLGGERRMRCLELSDGTRWDTPLDHSVQVVGGGAR